jgi:hypothetical protein
MDWKNWDKQYGWAQIKKWEDGIDPVAAMKKDLQELSEYQAISTPCIGQLIISFGISFRMISRTSIL